MTQRNTALDCLRGIAVLVVVLHHAGLAEFGWAGVDLFFVLSGYLITGILLEHRADANYYRVFYARRALRILPLYYVIWLVLIGVAFQQIGGALVVFSGLTFTLNFWIAAGEGALHVPYVIHHFWSLCVEEQFYLLWPPVVRRLRQELLLLLVPVLLVVALGLRWLYPQAGIYMTPSRLDGLAAGAAVAILLRLPWGVAWLERWWRPVLWVNLAGFAVLALTASDIHYTPRIWGRTMLILAFAALVAWQVLPSCKTPWRQPVLEWFGKYSYALYLVHPFVLRGLARFSVDPLLHFALVLVASSALARVSWWLIEAPFLRLKAHFPYGEPKRLHPHPTNWR